MKKIVFLFASLLFFVSSCNNNGFEKPEKLLSEDEMVSIIIDLSLLDAIRSQNMVEQQSLPTGTQLLKEKYKIDSLTFAKNTQYYASDVTKYKKMYNRVKIRLERENEKINGKKQEVTPDGAVIK